MALALAVICCLASGYFIVGLALGRRAQASASASDWLLRASLSAGYGIGAWSIIFFFARVLGENHLITIDLLVTASLAVVFVLGRAKFSETKARADQQPNIELPAWLHRFLKVVLAIALCAALYFSFLRSIVHPHGEGWDAFAIWNLHARFLFRGGDHWCDGLTSLIPWSHPDYPLLLPAAIAHFWTAFGRESTAIPAVIGVVFSFATVGLLCSSLAILRGRTCAVLGGLALLSTPFFVEQGSSQYADVPLSFFFLAAMALFHIHYARSSDESARHESGVLVLAGLAAGFALWTKNEGMLYLCATVFGQLFEFVGRPKTERPLKSWTALALFLATVAPFLLLLVGFKNSLAFSSELFSNQASLPEQATMIQKILDPARYWAIIQWYAKDFLRFGKWWPIPGTLLLPAFYFLLRNKHTAPECSAIRASAWTLAFTLAGYFAIYVITPYDLYWHLRFSLNRLFLQLWPCTIFLIFMAIPTGLVQKAQNGPDSLKRNAFPQEIPDATS